MVFKIVKEVRDINRLREILTVVFEEGFDFIVEKTRLKHKIPLTKRVKRRLEGKRKHSFEKRLRLTLERLGPTFIKFGQMLSVRPDLVPKSYIKELEKLQDEVPPFPYSTVKDEIKKDLGKDLNQIFSSFEKKPVASASISQVHKATTKNGNVVAVKVQRPNIRNVMETDIEIMFYVARLLEKHIEKIRRYQPVQVVQEFAKWTEKELDFKRESINAKRFARNFADSKKIKIPKIYEQYTTQKILISEFMEGIELHDIKQIKKKKINLRAIIDNGFEAILTQVLIHGFFHADPHPGNIIITKDKRIAFVDFGIVGHFDENLKNKSIDLFYGIINNDTGMVTDTLVEISNAEIENKLDLRNDISDILESLQDSDISKVKVSHALEEIMDVALSHKLKIPMEFVLFGKTVITLEGIALQYDPEFKIVERSRPFIEKLIAKRYSPVSVMDSFVKNMFKLRKYAEELPEQTSRALRRIEKGNIKVDIEDTDIKKLSLEIDRSGNRVAYSMIIAALLIVAALTINFGQPALLNMSPVSLMSFIIAIILSLILLYSILREKHIIK